MKELAPAAFLKIVAATAAALAVAVAGLNWLVDPLQFYRRAPHQPPLLIKEKRFQYPGLARNYDYDTVVVGTSLAENIAPDDLRATLGGTGLNLAMNGASIHEQRLLLEVALRTGRVRTVLWEINYEYLRGNPGWVSDFDGSFPAHFFDQNPLNELLPYLLSLATTKDSLRVLLGLSGLVPWQPASAERVFTWAWRKQFGPAAVAAVWRKMSAPGRRSTLNRIVEEMTVENMNRNFDRDVRAVIAAHPEVHFILFFAPVSVLRGVLFDSAAPDATRRVVLNKRHVLRASAGLANAELYDFQGLPAIVTDFTRYCDPGHYEPAVDRFILESIRDRRHRATWADAAELERIVASRPAAEWLAMIGCKPFPPVKPRK